MKLLSILILSFLTVSLVGAAGEPPPPSPPGGKDKSPGNFDAPPGGLRKPEGTKPHHVHSEPPPKDESSKPPSRADKPKYDESGDLNYPQPLPNHPNDGTHNSEHIHPSPHHPHKGSNRHSFNNWLPSWLYHARKHHSEWRQPQRYPIVMANSPQS